MSKNKRKQHGKNKVSWGCKGAYFLIKVGCEWGAAGMQTFKKLKEEDRDKCQPEQRRNEEKRGKINTQVLPVIFLLEDCVNILLG